MPLPVKFGAGRRKKEGRKTINTAGYIIKFERTKFGCCVFQVWFVWDFYFSLRHRKRSATGFDASK